MRLAWHGPIPLALLLALASGCSTGPSDNEPEGTVDLFLEAMERSEQDASALRDAYARISSSTRRALTERARYAESLGGARLDPWQMLVRGRFRQTFAPAPGRRGIRSEIDGERAVVVYTNEAGDRRAEVPLVLENGRWRIVLDIPPLRREVDRDGASEEGAEEDGAERLGAEPVTPPSAPPG